MDEINSKEDTTIKLKTDKNSIMSTIDKLLVVIIVLFSAMKREQEIFYNNSIVVNCFNYIYLIALIILVARTTITKFVKNDTTKYNIMLFAVGALMIVIETISLIFNREQALLYGFENFKRAGITIISAIVVPIMIFSFFKAAKEQVVNYITIGYLINQIVVMIIRTISFGPLKAFQDITGSFSIKNSTASIFEIHMATYCLGILIIYYLWNIIDSKRKHQSLNKKTIALLVLLLFFFLLGNKRIAILALVIAAIAMFIILKIRINKKKILAFSAAIIIIIISYIGIIYNGQFYKLNKSAGIDTSGRSLLYRYITDKSDFSINALPWGLDTVNVMLENVPYQEIHQSYIAVALHNDLLRTYVEFGFIGFVLWLAIIALFIPYIIFKTLSAQTLKMYYVLLIYALILFSTSNAYYLTNIQTLLFLIPMVINEKTRENKDEKQKTVI